jgi:hypothetical protein
VAMKNPFMVGQLVDPRAFERDDWKRSMRGA